jgi:hypothetical protein
VHNWCAWIHGNVLIAGLRLWPTDRDGTSWSTSPSPVSNGSSASIPPTAPSTRVTRTGGTAACRALEALDVLAHASGGALGGDLIGALRESVAFPHRMQLGGAWYLNLPTAGPRPAGDQPWDSLHRAARRVGDRSAEAHAAAHRRPAGPVADERSGLGRLLRALTDPAWDRGRPSRSPLPREVWLPSTQVLLARPRTDARTGWRSR